MKHLATKRFDPLAAARAAEIDEVIESLACFAGPRPTKVDVMFESLLLAYAALRSRHRTDQVRVLLGAQAYERAKASGLLAWCREQYPDLLFEPPSQTARGPQASLMVLDEIKEMP